MNTRLKLFLFKFKSVRLQLFSEMFRSSVVISSAAMNVMDLNTCDRQEQLQSAAEVVMFVALESVRMLSFPLTMSSIVCSELRKRSM